MDPYRMVLAHRQTKPHGHCSVGTTVIDDGLLLFVVWCTGEFGRVYFPVCLYCDNVVVLSPAGMMSWLTTMVHRFRTLVFVHRCHNDAIHCTTNSGYYGMPRCKSYADVAFPLLTDVSVRPNLTWYKQ